MGRIDSEKTPQEHGKDFFYGIGHQNEQMKHLNNPRTRADFIQGAKEASKRHKSSNPSNRK